MQKRIIGNSGLVIAILLACAFCAADYWFGSPQNIEENMGSCFPSPNLWPIDPLLSRIANFLLIVLAGIMLHIFNKTYNLINDNDTVLPAAFIIFCSSNPWVGSMLSSSIMLVWANIISLFILFRCYRKESAPREIFLVGTIFSIGSMFQYAFLAFIPIYILICWTLKCINFKGIIALLMGTVAPYWIGIGLGLIPLDSFTMPAFTYMLDVLGNKQTLLVGLLNCGVTILITFLLTLYNAVKLYAGNTRRRLFNNALILLGVASAIFMVCDFDNIPVYLPTLYMVAAAQIANLFALHNLHHPRAVIWVLLLLFTASFIFMEKIIA